jgi:MscS family membrane protein
MNSKWKEIWETFISIEHLKDLGIAIGIFLLFLIFRKLFTKYIFALLKRLVKRTRINLFSNILISFEKPVQWLFIVLGILAAVTYYPYLDPDNELFRDVIKALIIILLTWGLVQLSSTSSEIFRSINNRTSIKIDEILIPLLSRALQFVIIAISISIVLGLFGYRIDGLVAGFGLGGLAISLAAKDALANMFGGIVIISEKPFTIGDWILTPSVEGTVEDITFRSTKIRTFAQAVVTLPNATLANEPITNWSKMGKRQISFYLRLTYDTPREKMEVVISRMRELLRNHPEIHPETIMVNFEKYMDNGVDIFLYFFTKTTNWEKYLHVREDINFKILEILEQEQVYIAIPSRKLYVNSEGDNQFGIIQEKDR